MTDRSATATIKGYFYQFDQTIVRLLEASKHASVTVEGIEDIDLDDKAGPLVVSCGNQHTQWLVVVGPGGHVGKSRERLVHMSMGRV